MKPLFQFMMIGCEAIILIKLIILNIANNVKVAPCWRVTYDLSWSFEPGNPRISDMCNMGLVLWGVFVTCGSKVLVRSSLYMTNSPEVVKY